MKIENLKVVTIGVCLSGMLFAGCSAESPMDVSSSNQESATSKNEPFSADGKAASKSLAKALRSIGGITFVEQTSKNVLAVEGQSTDLDEIMQKKGFGAVLSDTGIKKKIESWQSKNPGFIVEFRMYWIGEAHDQADGIVFPAK